MKIEIDDTVLIDTIVVKVVKSLTPLIKQNSKSNDNELMTVEECKNAYQLLRTTLKANCYGCAS